MTTFTVVVGLQIGEDGHANDSSCLAVDVHDKPLLDGTISQEFRDRPKPLPAHSASAKLSSWLVWPSDMRRLLVVCIARLYSGRMSQQQTQPQRDGGGAGRPPLGTAVGGGQPGPGRRHPFRSPDETPANWWRWWRALRLELARVSWPSAEATVRAIGVVATSVCIGAGFLLTLNSLLSRLP